MDTLSPLPRFPSPFSSANSTGVTRIDNQRSATKLSPAHVSAKMNIHFSLSRSLRACHPGYGTDHLYHDFDESIEISVAKLLLPNDETWPRLFLHCCWCSVYGFDLWFCPFRFSVERSRSIRKYRRLGWRRWRIQVWNFEFNNYFTIGKIFSNYVIINRIMFVQVLLIVFAASLSNIRCYYSVIRCNSI